MQGQESDAAYFVRRAREEAYLAFTAEKPEIAAAHYGLSIRHMARAREVRDHPLQWQSIAMAPDMPGVQPDPLLIGEQC